MIEPLLPKWMNSSAWYLVAVCLVGCSGSHRTTSASTETVRQQPDYPASALSELSSNVIAEINSVSAEVVVPSAAPFGDNEELRRVYSEWYRKGYAFAFVTGSEHVRDWAYRADPVERAKALGWFDGNSAGGLARHLKAIGAAVEQMSSNRSNSIR